MKVPLLPLEAHLNKNKNNKSKFPDKNGDYFNRYMLIKEWLDTNIYKQIGAAAAAKDGQFYNDHGVDHFNAVIRHAGYLIGQNTNSDKQKILNPYEVYLLLCAILLHDAGMVYGRGKHEKKAHQLLTQMGDLAIGDSFERILISNIVEVHGGRSNEGDKDTIGKKNMKDIDFLLDCSFRPKVIASILRFADEICEDKMRAARFLLKSKKVKKSNQVFHKYADSINSARVELLDKTIRIDYKLMAKDLNKLYGKLKTEVYIVDEIMERLEKIFLEMKYCSRFFNQEVRIARIRANIDIVDNKYQVIENIPINIEDIGYPKPNFHLSELYPEINGLILAQKYR